MRLFGFKLSRLREWREVLREEGRYLNWRDKLWLAWKMTSVFFRGLFIRDRRWREKIRVCGRCPLYGRRYDPHLRKVTGLRRCRRYTGSSAGCGCDPAVLAFFSDSCWGDDYVPGEIGWNAKAIAKEQAEASEAERAKGHSS